MVRGRNSKLSFLFTLYNLLQVGCALFGTPTPKKLPVCPKAGYRLKDSQQPLE
jgi:hypothetical protein